VSGFSRTGTVRLKADTTYDFTVRLKADTTYDFTVRLKADTTYGSGALEQGPEQADIAQGLERQHGLD
jgi:hypothetical protein